MGMTPEDFNQIREMFSTTVTSLEAKFDEKLAALKPQIEAGAELSAALLSNDPQAKQIALEQARKQQEAVNLEAQRIVQLEIAEQRRKNDIVNLSTRLVTGDTNVAYGLPIVQVDLQGMLEKLPADQLPSWQNLLTTIQKNGRIDYREHGHGKILAGTKQLPSALVADLQSGELKLTDLSNPILNLGDLSQYDLSAFKGGK